MIDSLGNGSFAKFGKWIKSNKQTKFSVEHELKQALSMIFPQTKNDNYFEEKKPFKPNKWSIQQIYYYALFVAEQAITND